MKFGKSEISKFNPAAGPDAFRKVMYKKIGTGASFAYYDYLCHSYTATPTIVRVALLLLRLLLLVPNMF